MNRTGHLTDRYGKLLTVGDSVLLCDGVQEHIHDVGHRNGTVTALYPVGDWAGYVSVAFRGASKATHKVPDTALELLPTAPACPTCGK